jgi:hypothetical protein
MAGVEHGVNSRACDDWPHQIAHIEHLVHFGPGYSFLKYRQSCKSWSQSVHSVIVMGI